VAIAILILLLLAAAAGVLGAVLKAALVLILASILAVVVIIAGSYYYLRYRVRRFMRDADARYRTFPSRDPRGAYPTQGYKRPGGGRELPE
jgi:hypothetical protein